MDNAEAVLEELHVIYQLALDVAEYTEAASSVLLLCEQMQGIDVGERALRAFPSQTKHTYIHTQFVQSHWLVMRIWKTLTQFYHIQTMWLSDASGYKRGTISLYGVMSQLFNKVPSTTYPLVVQHWVNYSKPLETMQRIFEPLGSMVSLSIQSMWNEFNKFGYVTGERLRKDALLQLTTNVKAVPKDDLVGRTGAHRNSSHYSFMYTHSHSASLLSQ